MKAEVDYLKYENYDIRKILKGVIENELKNAEVIMKDKVDYLKYENLQSIAVVLKRNTAVIKMLEEKLLD